jgi:hypothetical protein
LAIIAASQAADPNWKTLVVPEIDDEEKLLAARLIANFHRRHVETWDKKEWINGLAKIYKDQGLAPSVLIGGRYHNEIKEKESSENVNNVGNRWKTLTSSLKTLKT